MVNSEAFSQPGIASFAYRTEHTTGRCCKPKPSHDLSNHQPGPGHGTAWQPLWPQPSCRSWYAAPRIATRTIRWSHAAPLAMLARRVGWVCWDRGWFKAWRTNSVKETLKKRTSSTLSTFDHKFPWSLSTCDSFWEWGIPRIWPALTWLLKTKIEVAWKSKAQFLVHPTSCQRVVLEAWQHLFITCIILKHSVQPESEPLRPCKVSSRFFSWGVSSSKSGYTFAAAILERVTCFSFGQRFFHKVISFAVSCNRWNCNVVSNQVSSTCN